jgi:hypothetical protein
MRREEGGPRLRGGIGDISLLRLRPCTFSVVRDESYTTRAARCWRKRRKQRAENEEEREGTGLSTPESKGPGLTEAPVVKLRYRSNQGMLFVRLLGQLPFSCHASFLSFFLCFSGHRPPLLRFFCVVFFCSFFTALYRFFQLLFVLLFVFSSDKSGHSIPATWTSAIANRLPTAAHRDRSVHIWLG